MATEDIIIRYKADVSQLESDLDKLVQTQQELLDTTKRQTNEVQKSANAQAFAQKKRLQLLENERQTLVKLREASKLAFDPAEIEKFNRKIEESNRRIALLSGNAKKQSESLNQLGDIGASVFGRIGGLAAAAFSIDAIISFGNAAVQTFARFETLQVSFQTLIGDVRVANDLFNQLKDFSIKTPFTSEEVQSAAKSLISFGFTTSNVFETIKTLGDVSAGTGKNLQELAIIFGQVYAAGRLTSNELLQLVTAGFNPLQAISEKTGKSQAQLRKEIEKGNISFEQVAEAFKIATSEGGRFYDMTNQLAQTTAGQLSTIQDQSDLLAASIGEKLAPSFLSAKKSFLEFADTLVEFTLFSKQEREIKSVQKRIKELGETTKAEVEGQTKVFQEALGLGTLEAQLKGIEGVRKRINKELDLYVGSSTAEGQRRAADLKYELDALVDLEFAYRKTAEEEAKAAEIRANAEKEKAKEVADKRIKEAQRVAAEVKKILDGLDDEIRKFQEELAKRRIEVLPEDSQKQEEDKIKALADLEEKSINDEIALRIKAVNEDEKLSTQQKDDIIKKYRELKQARLDLARFNEQNELNIVSAEQVKRIEEATKQIDDLDIEQALVIEADKVKKANEEVEKSFESLGEVISKFDFEIAKESLNARTEALNDAVKDEFRINLTRIKANRDAELQKVKDGEAADRERSAINQKYAIQIQKLYADTDEKIKENNAKTNAEIEEQEKNSYDRRVQQTFQYLDVTAQVIGEIANLFSEFSNQRISEIEEIKEAELKSIDEQEERIEKDLEFRRITDEQARLQKEELERAKVRAEEEAAKKIRDIKRKQAILDKTSALFQIAINTAKNITEQPGPFGSLVGLWIALGLAQAGVVVAQPIPYKKGSKDTGAKGHMARVGEEGEEIVYMPSHSKVLPAKQTNQYGEILDAMFDNKLNQYIAKTYVSPALEKQKKAYDTQKEESFANNITKSLYFNGGLNANEMDRIRRKGQPITNVDEIAKAIASNLPTYDPYRR